jgi:muramoyltetrapeptide carboxypeptidase
MDDESIEAIICARGGFGSLRTVDLIDFSKFMRKPKWAIGFSDITVFHNAINSRGICSLHATVPVHFQKHESSTKLMLETLCGKISPTEWNTSFAGNLQTEGIVCGGNLSLLYALNGSGDLFNPTGKLIFTEDLDEYYYHVDRMVTALKRNGYFKETNAVILGGFDQMKDNPVPFGMNETEIMKYHANGSFPVVPDFPAGHGIVNTPLIMGAKYKLETASQKAKLSLVF